MRMQVVVSLVLLAATVSGCVWQRHLDAWKGQPVEALDTQTFFISLPMIKRVTPKGVEIRNYVNGINTAQCFNLSGFQNITNCVSRRRACNNIFFIKDGRVLEYAPSGSGGARCMTDESVLPSTRRY